MNNLITKNGVFRYGALCATTLLRWMVSLAQGYRYGRPSRMGRNNTKTTGKVRTLASSRRRMVTPHFPPTTLFKRRTARPPKANPPQYWNANKYDWKNSALLAKNPATHSSNPRPPMTPEMRSTLAAPDPSRMIGTSDLW